MKTMIAIGSMLLPGLWLAAAGCSFGRDSQSTMTGGDGDGSADAAEGEGFVDGSSAEPDAATSTDAGGSAGDRPCSPYDQSCGIVECLDDCDCISTHETCVKGTCSPTDRLPEYEGCSCAVDHDCAPTGNRCLNGICTATPVGPGDAGPAPDGGCGGDPPLCEYCGQPYPAACSNGQWACTGGGGACPDGGPGCISDCDCIEVGGSCGNGLCVPMDRMPEYLGCPCSTDRQCALAGVVCRYGLCTAETCPPLACDESAPCLFGQAADSTGCPTCDCLTWTVTCSSGGALGVPRCPDGYLCVSSAVSYPPEIGYCIRQCAPENEPPPEPAACPPGSMCREAPGWSMGHLGPSVCMPPCPAVKCASPTVAGCWYGYATDHFGCQTCECAPPPVCTPIVEEDRCWWAGMECLWEPIDCDSGPCPQCTRDLATACVLSGGLWNSDSGCICPAGTKLDPNEPVDCVPDFCPEPGPDFECQIYCPDGFQRDPATGCKMCQCIKPADCYQRPADMCEGLGYCMLRLPDPWSSAILECVNRCESNDQCPDGWCDLSRGPGFCMPWLP